MSLNDPALGFSHQKPKVRIVVIVLWCLVVLLAFLTSWTAGVAASGTGGSITDRTPSYPFILVGTSVLGFGAMVVDISTAKVRDDKAGWSVLRLFGSLGLGLSAGAGAHAVALKSFPAWWIPIMVLLSIGILCLPAGLARLMQRHESKRKY